MARYVCGQPDSTRTTAYAASLALPMPDCTGMKLPAATALCVRHCHPDHSTSADLRILHVPEALAPSVRYAAIAAATHAALIGFDPQVRACATDPPFPLRYCSLLL